MNNEKNFRFADFTLDNYKKILRIALESYHFNLFTDTLMQNNKIIFLRHDIEFSIPIALKMAEIEADLGIKATYFVQLHGEFYNALEKRNVLAIEKIMYHGHQLGLHFDAHYWEVKSEDELEKYILQDKLLLEQFFKIEPRVISFHNTNSFILSCEAESYSGLINVYSKRFKSSIGYCSDSTGYWRFEVLEDRIREAKDDKLQILIHDGMWQNELLPPRRRVFKVIDDHATLMKKNYDETLKKFGAKNIDWDSII